MLPVWLIRGQLCSARLGMRLWLDAPLVNDSGRYWCRSIAQILSPVQVRGNAACLIRSRFSKAMCWKSFGIVRYSWRNPVTMWLCIGVVRFLEYLKVTHGSSWSLPQISGLNEDSTRTRPGLGQDWTRTGCGLDVESPAKLTIFQSTSSPLVIQSTWTWPCAVSRMRSGLSGLRPCPIPMESSWSPWRTKFIWNIIFIPQK